MSDIMSSFEEKTSFDELKAQNQRFATELEFANNCLNVLIEFKNVFNRIIDTKSKRKLLYLKEEDIQELEELNEKYDKVLADKQIKSEVNEENKELFVSQNIDSSNSLNRSTNQSLNSKPQIITVQNNGMPATILPATTIPSNTNLVVKCFQLIPGSSIGSHIGPFIGSPIGPLLVTPIDTQPCIMSSPPINKLPIARLNASIPNIKVVDPAINNTPKAIPNVCSLKRQVKSNTLRKPKVRLKYNYYYKCIVNKCNKTYESLAVLQCHQKESHGLHLQKANINYLKCYTCDYPDCGKDFGNPNRLRSHRRSVHVAVDKYKCDFVGCGKTFKQERNLNDHLKLHSDGPYFHCSYNDCNYKTKINRYLKSHENSHSEKKPFKCKFNDCGARFKWKASLKGHFRTHDKERPTVLCPVKNCGKLVKPHYLQTHLLLHSDEKVSCDYPQCQYKHTLEAEVERHKRRVHITERNFVCDWPECGKSFKNNGELLGHKRRHKNDRPHACEWPGCEYRAFDLQSMANHFRIHTKEKPFECEWPGCDYRCAIEHNLKKHWKIHQKD